MLGAVPPRSEAWGQLVRFTISASLLVYFLAIWGIPSLFNLKILALTRHYVMITHYLYFKRTICWITGLSNPIKCWGYLNCQWIWGVWKFGGPNSSGGTPDPCPSPASMCRHWSWLLQPRSVMYRVVGHSSSRRVGCSRLEIDTKLVLMIPLLCTCLFNEILFPLDMYK